MKVSLKRRYLSGRKKQMLLTATGKVLLEEQANEF